MITPASVEGSAMITLHGCAAIPSQCADTLHVFHAAELSLGAEFQRCATRAQNRNKARKKNSLLNLRLNDYRQVYFSREDRKAIPPALIEEIK
jgi:hypothetical protein